MCDSSSDFFKSESSYDLMGWEADLSLPQSCLIRTHLFLSTVMLLIVPIKCSIWRYRCCFSIFLACPGLLLLARFLLVAINLNSTHIQALLRGPAYEKNSMHTPVVVMSRLYWLFGNKMCFELWVNISNSSGYIDWLENGCRRSD